MRIPGIVHRAELARRDVGRAQVRAWQRAGTVRTVHHWYVFEDAPQDVVALLRFGVRPTCLDAAALYGLWTPPHPGVHVYRPRVSAAESAGATSGARQIRRRIDAASGRLVTFESDRADSRFGRAQRLVHHRPFVRNWPDTDPVPDLDLVLAHAVRCLPMVKAAILLESALDRGAVSLDGVQQILRSVPQRSRQQLSRVRADAQSGTETAVRWWLESIGVTVRSQVAFTGVGRVDMLVGAGWVIECDSRRFHDDPAQYERDRERDLVLRSRGFTVTRLTWEQVFLTWATTRELLRAVLRHRDHRRAPRI